MQVYLEFFSDLFNSHYYTPESVLDIYRDAENALKHIYFECLTECDYIDYQGTFLSNFVSRDMDWIMRYVQYILNRQGKHRTIDEEDRLALCWKQDGFLNIFDTYFDELLHNKPLFWHNLIHFQNALAFNGQEDDRKEQWIIHYIKEKSNSENLIELFRVLQEMKKEIRKKAILLFLEYNSDFELFKRLSMVSNSWSGTAGLTDKIMFYEDLLSEITGVQYLNHKKWISHERDKWKSQRNREEMEEILLKIYQ